jgi:hypothetical protein
MPPPVERRFGAMLAALYRAQLLAFTRAASPSAAETTQGQQNDGFRETEGFATLSTCRLM